MSSARLIIKIRCKNFRNKRRTFWRLAIFAI